MGSLWSPFSMWPEGRSTQLLPMVKLSSPSGPREQCVNIWENAHLMLVLWLNVLVLASEYPLSLKREDLIGLQAM